MIFMISSPHPVVLVQLLTLAVGTRGITAWKRFITSAQVHPRLVAGVKLGKLNYRVAGKLHARNWRIVFRCICMQRRAGNFA
jgi:hypothetical protein